MTYDSELYPICPEESGNNLGAAYNTFTSLLGDDDWACFIDHDAMFTTGNVICNMNRSFSENHHAKHSITTSCFTGLSVCKSSRNTDCNSVIAKESISGTGLLISYKYMAGNKELQRRISEI